MPMGGRSGRRLRGRFLGRRRCWCRSRRRCGVGSGVWTADDLLLPGSGASHRRARGDGCTRLLDDAGRWLGSGRRERWVGAGRRDRRDRSDRQHDLGGRLRRQRDRRRRHRQERGVGPRRIRLRSDAHAVGGNRCRSGQSRENQGEQHQRCRQQRREVVLKTETAVPRRSMSDDRTRDESRRIAASHKSRAWSVDLPDPCMCSPTFPLPCRRAQTPREALVERLPGRIDSQADERGLRSGSHLRQKGGPSGGSHARAPCPPGLRVPDRTARRRGSPSP